MIDENVRFIVSAFGLGNFVLGQKACIGKGNVSRKALGGNFASYSWVLGALVSEGAALYKKGFLWEVHIRDAIDAMRRIMNRRWQAAQQLQRILQFWSFLSCSKTRFKDQEEVMPDGGHVGGQLKVMADFFQLAPRQPFRPL